MKFALLFFCCFVSISHQEVERYIAPRNHPRSLYVPLFYADGLPAGYDIIQNNDHQANVSSFKSFLVDLKVIYHQLLGG